MTIIPEYPQNKPWKSKVLQMRGNSIPSLFPRSKNLCKIVFFFQGDRFFPFRDVIDEPDDLEEGPDDAPGAPWEFEDEIQWLEWHLSLE